MGFGPEFSVPMSMSVSKCEREGPGGEGGAVPCVCLSLVSERFVSGRCALWDLCSCHC